MASLTSPTKKYNLLKEQLREMALNAGIGTQILSERQLAEMYGVSRNTARKAIGDLVEEGLIKRVAGSGAYVCRNDNTERALTMFYCTSIRSTDLFNNTLLEAVTREVTSRGDQLEVNTLASDDLDPASVAGADGLILTHHQLNPALLPADMPIVVPLYAEFTIPNATYILVDDYLAGMKAARHLIELGHTRLAYVGMMDARTYGGWVHERYWGVRDALKNVGAEAPFLFDALTQSVDEGLPQIVREQQITGLVCGNDQLALSCISSLHKAGIHVPEQVSVIGFDDLPISASFFPPLTTMRIHIDQIASTIVEELRQRIIGSPDTFPPRRILLPMELIERASCRAIG